MSCYISSNQNRFYAALEAAYGDVAAVSEPNRIPAIKLAIRQEIEERPRRDKTGGRTYVGVSNGFRRRTTFDLETYLTGLADPAVEPGYGPLFQAALGAGPALFPGGTVQFMPEPSQVTFSGPHGLSPNQAITIGGEMRFVAAILDESTAVLNAPFTFTPEEGAPVGATLTYLPSEELPSVSVHDYWDPQESVQRILAGCGVDEMRIRLNGDFHQFRFRGPAKELVDSATFQEGQAGLVEFPQEPETPAAGFSLVPGNLGQVWFGNLAAQFYTVLDAEIVLDNNLDTRSREFGSEYPRCLVAGRRSVVMNFSLYSNNRPETRMLYEAARQRSPIAMMLQLGQDIGHLCGVYMKSVVPAVPEFDDTEARLQWRFSNNQAIGAQDDELAVAFG